MKIADTPFSLMSRLDSHKSSRQSARAKEELDKVKVIMSSPMKKVTDDLGDEHPNKDLDFNSTV